jgi:hypothetical protein
MRGMVLVLALWVGAAGAAGVSEAQDGAGAAALARFRALAGDWEGSFAWTGGRSDAGKMNAAYYLTGNGSAVVENLSLGGAPVMTTVYHLDGADLRMTHYCGAQNQPRLKAQRIDLAQGIVDFSFVDATNLVSPDAPHVNGLEVRFLDADHITLAFRFESGAKHSLERINLERAPKKPS